MSVIEIHYWPIRGLVMPILSLCEYVGQKYTFVKVTDKQAYFGSKQALFESGMEYPNLPYLIDGETKIAETMAIMVYIAKKNGRVDLLPTTDDLSEWLMHFTAISDLNGSIIRPSYNAKTLEEFLEECKASIEFHHFKYQS